MAIYDLLIPSMILKGDIVDTIRVNFSRALSNNSLYSFSVRSQPGKYCNICKSRNFAGDGSLPSGTTISTTNTFPPSVTASRQF